MVGSALSVTRNGLRDWLIQRISAVILGLYTLFLVGFLMLHSPLQYLDWHNLFANGFMRVFTFLAMLSLLYHTWIGMWTIFTDYIKPPVLRFGIQILVIIALIGYLVWGISIVWGF